MIGRMFYAIRQGFKNIGRNRLFSLASVGTITACLFIFGIFYCIVVNFQYMVHAAESNVGVTVFFDETVTEDKMLEVQRLIDAREEVSSTTYISADEAWENFKQDYFPDGDEGILAGLDQDNPLVDCASVQVYLADTSRQAELISYIEGLEGVSEVNASDIIADSFTNFSRLIGYVSLGIILILVFVAIFLISNTVMIGITVRKEEIAIMKYIGATDLSGTLSDGCRLRFGTLLNIKQNTDIHECERRIQYPYSDITCYRSGYWFYRKLYDFEKTCQSIGREKRYETFTYKASQCTDGPCNGFFV